MTIHPAIAAMRDAVDAEIDQTLNAPHRSIPETSNAILALLSAKLGPLLDALKSTQELLDHARSCEIDEYDIAPVEKEIRAAVAAMGER